MPAPKLNQNAKKDETDSSFLYVRCHPKAKAAWVRTAGSRGLSAWTKETLNKAAKAAGNDPNAPA